MEEPMEQVKEELEDEGEENSTWEVFKEICDIADSISSSSSARELLLPLKMMER